MTIDIIHDTGADTLSVGLSGHRETMYRSVMTDGVETLPDKRTCCIIHNISTRTAEWWKSSPGAGNVIPAIRWEVLQWLEWSAK